MHARLLASERALWDSLGVTPHEHRLHLRALGTTVRVQEVGEGPPVLFIHGGISWGTSWADLASVLAPSFRCLLLDRPGTGASDPLPPPLRGPEAIATTAGDLVPDVMDALGLPAAHVVATSFGGWFALRGALTSPDRIDRMVMVGWTAGAPTSDLPFGLKAVSSAVVSSVASRLPVNRTAVRSIFRSIGEGAALDGGAVSAEAIDAYVALLNHTDTFRNEHAAGRLFLAGRGQLTLTADERTRIPTPIHFLWGEVDPFGGPEIARAFVAPFPDASLTLIPNAGHAPWMGDPGSIAGRVADGLAQRDLSP